MEESITRIKNEYLRKIEGTREIIKKFNPLHPFQHTAKSNIELMEEFILNLDFLNSKLYSGESVEWTPTQTYVAGERVTLNGVEQVAK